MSTPDQSASLSEEQIFEVATALPAAERATYLDTACAGDVALRVRLERLLASNEHSAFMQRTVLEPEPEDIARQLARLKPEKGGERIGDYKLLEKIGEGGFGVVWVAEQERPVRRRVALKIIKLGMDTREVIARFEQERQALALMDHPHIAKVFDAGATESGRPFFVMELVRGIKITEYCDQAKLPTAARLDLFIAVCKAVQHAHQKGIIHRDIKPSNILVTLHEGLPVPKVIDFGVAKATQQQRLTDLTIYTQFEQMIGTPLYMSPEQAEMSGLDIDTRSDIYSLGVLLYELLTGRTPFDPEKLMRQGIDEIRRSIREQEPRKPSTVLSTMEFETCASIAQSRQADGAKLVGLVRGDLDWIVMKALEKDRVRRYETAVGFARDIERHLASEPVLARPPSATYKLSRFARRNKGTVAATGAIAAILIAATIVSSWSAFRAGKAEKLASHRLAESERARAEATMVATLFKTVFQSPDPARDGRTITVAETLDRAVKNLDTDIAWSEPERRAEMQATLGLTYYSLGLSREAIPVFEQARDFYVATYGRGYETTVAAFSNLALLYDDVGRYAEALELREEVLAFGRNAQGPEHPDTITAMNNLAISYSHVNRPVDALRLREEVLALSVRVNGEEHPDTLDAINNLALSYSESDRGKEALELWKRLLPLRRKVNGARHPDTLKAMSNLASSYSDTGRNDKALKLWEEVLPLRREVLGAEHPDTLGAMTGLASSYFHAGRGDDALALREEVFALYRKARGAEHVETLGAMTNLAVSYGAAGGLPEAIELQEQSLAIKRRVLPETHPYFGVALQQMASLYNKAGRFDEALPLREELLALRRKMLGAGHSNTRSSMEKVAIAYVGARRWSEALGLFTELSGLSPENTIYPLRVAALQAWLGQEKEHAATSRQQMARAAGTEKASTAERAAKAYCLRASSDPALLAQAVALAKRSGELGKNDEFLRYFHLALGMAEYRSEHFEAADRELAAADKTAGGDRFVLSVASAFHAMSLFQQGKIADARKWLAAAETQMDPLPTDGSLQKGTPALEMLECWVAFREARALLDSGITR